MIDWNRSEKSARRHGLVVWVGAGVIIMGIHIGLFSWFLQTPTEALSDGVQTVVMIELAPEPQVAESSDETVTSPQERPTIASQSEETPSSEPEIPEPAPEENASEEPVPEESAPEEIPEEEALLPEKVEEPEQSAVSLPVPSKKPVIKPLVSKPPSSKKPESRVVPVEQARGPQPVSEKTAAPQPVSGRSGTSVETAEWSSRLMAHLERRKRYPSGARGRREQGVVHVRFSIDGSGNVRSVFLEKSSGHDELDNEVLALVRRVSPVPAPPLGAGKSVVVPVKFSLR